MSQDILLDNSAGPILIPAPPSNKRIRVLGLQLSSNDSASIVFNSYNGSTLDEKLVVYLETTQSVVMYPEETGLFDCNDGESLRILALIGEFVEYGGSLRYTIL